MLKEGQLNAFQKNEWTIHLEEQDALAVRSYPGNITLYYGICACIITVSGATLSLCVHRSYFAVLHISA
jgi:hypothetical protein